MVRRNSLAKSRPAYTLLEVVLSVALAVFLMGGLYVAMWAQYDQTTAGREIIDQATIARSIFRRMSTDILSHLPPVDPRLPTASAEEAPAEEPVEGEEEETEMDAAAEADLGNSAPSFNRAMLLYSDDMLLLSGRYPRELKFGMPKPTEVNQEELSVVCDLRLVRYWLVTEGDKSKGLARIEVANIASQLALDAAGGDEPPNPTIIAPEVKAMTLRFFGDQDGDVGWHDVWDGAAMPAGGDMLDDLLFSTEAPAQVGPPAAVEITLKLGRLGLKEDDDVEANWKTFRHVVAIPTANGLTPLSELQGAAMPELLGTP